MQTKRNSKVFSYCLFSPLIFIDLNLSSIMPSNLRLTAKLCFWKIGYFEALAVIFSRENLLFSSERLEKMTLIQCVHELTWSWDSRLCGNRLFLPVSPYFNGYTPEINFFWKGPDNKYFRICGIRGKI